MNRLLPGHRIPYIGDGADGARRSAEIDREEADCLDRDDPRWGDRVESADRWERQAHDLEKVALVITHTRTDPGVEGPDICGQCSEAVQEYVQWPCPTVVEASRS